MQTLRDGYKGLSLLVDLSWDRFFFGAAIGAALLASTWVATRIPF